MTRLFLSSLKVLAISTTLVAADAATAQESSSPFSVFGRLFGGGDNAASADETQRVAQASPADLTVRIDRLEAQIRQMTGTIEQLQYRNQQLEAQLKRLQEASGPQPPSALLRPPVPPGGPAQAAPPTTIRRSDAFDPLQNPNAPGAPRALGTLGPLPPPSSDQGTDVADTTIGAPGGRLPGAPLDLTTMGPNASNDPNMPQSSALPPPPARNLSSTGVVASTLPPSASPRDQYDLGYGYLQRRDYALAEDAFQTFLTRFPADKLVADAQFWLGESRFQRQRYDAAAESFLAVSTKHGTSTKAPDAMLRLGQSLAALGQREMACATFAEVGRKYPRASANVRQNIEREQKRVSC